MVATAIYSVTSVLWKKNRISSLQSHGKALEKECCLPGVFCDGGDTPANLLSELNGHIMPCTSCFYGKWVEDACAGQFGVSAIVRCCLCDPTFSRFSRTPTCDRRTDRQTDGQTQGHG